MFKYFVRTLFLVLLLALAYSSGVPITGQRALDLADCAKVGFSVEEDFVTQGPVPADGNPIISDGDLLGPLGQVCVRNAGLLSAFATVAALPDLGLDAADVLSVEEDQELVAFSTELDDPQGRFTAGDLLTTNGSVLPNAALLAAFQVGGDLGLDGIHVLGDTDSIIAFFDGVLEKGRDYWVENPTALVDVLVEHNVDLWFTTEGTGTTASGDVFLDGDLLSAASGSIVFSNGVLLAAPIPAGLPNRGVDFGLDAVSASRRGDRSSLVLSTEIRYQESGVSFTDGDVLGFGGGVVTVNADLVTPFEPRARMLGLDALSYPGYTGLLHDVFLPIVMRSQPGTTGGRMSLP